MEYNITQAIDFMREKLFTVFEKGCHLTASAPIIIQPAPPKLELVTACLLEGDDLLFNKDGSANPTKKLTMATVLDNTIKSMNLLQSSSNNYKYPPSRTDQIVLPLLRRLMPKLSAFDLAGVQPLTSPLGYVHTLRVRYRAEEAEADTQSSATLSIPKKVEDKPILEDKASFGRLSIQILKEQVEAKTRRFCARWSSVVDADAEVLEMLASEMAAEIDDELLKTFFNLLPGDPYLTFDMKTYDAEATPFVGDAMTMLAIQINRAANLIAARTRRGAGNYCVVSPTALTILQSSGTAAFVRSPTASTHPSSPTSISYVGKLNNYTKVYVNQYASDKEPVLVGYRGSDIDTPVIYSPFIPVASSGMVIDPQTFDPNMTFMTRSGMLTLPNSPLSLGNAADYVNKIGINTDTLSFL